MGPHLALENTPVIGLWYILPEHQLVTYISDRGHCTI